MVAEDLVQLDKPAAALLEPRCEALVKIGADGLRKRVVGGIANEEVPEAEAVLAHELWLVRPDQLLANERGEARGHVRLLWGERLHGAAMEYLPFHRAPLEHAPFGGLELIQPRRQQRAESGRDDDLAVRLGSHRQHLADEERVAARRVRDPLAQLPADVLRHQLGDVVVAERLEAERHRPGRAALRELGTGEAEEQDRCAGREERDVFDQVEEGLFAPLDVVEDDDQRSLRRGLLERLAERPRDLVRGRRRVVLSEQRADGEGRGLVRGPQSELLQDLDHGEVGDPLAVGKATTADDVRLDRGQRLHDEPGLADTGVADDRNERAAALGLHPLPRLENDARARLPSDEERLVTALRRVSDDEEAVCIDGLGFALELEWLDGLEGRRPADERDRRRADQHLSRLCCLLEAGRHVHRVTGREPFLGAGDDLAGHDADPSLQAELGQRVAHLRRGANRSQRVVLVHRRHAEDRHHRVADELLDCAAVALDDRLHSLEVRPRAAPATAPGRPSLRATSSR